VSDIEVLEALLEARRNGTPAVLATIVRESGSVPRHAGSKMLAFADGRLIGSVGGGEMENRVIASVRRLIEQGKPEMLHYSLVDPTRGDPGVCGGQMEIFMEPIVPDPTVLVIGCGHCGQALADLAHWAGFRVIVADDRADLCNPQVIPHADLYLPVPAAEIASAAPIHSRTFVASVTRGMLHDVDMLPDLLKTAAPYIGVMGSRRQHHGGDHRLCLRGGCCPDALDGDA